MVYAAEVYERNGLVHRMAVKLANAEIMADADLLARARDEARLMSQLNHDHVVRVHALTEIEGRAAVLMEYIEGVDCSQLLLASHPQGLPPTVAGGIIERAASALHAAWTTISPETGKPLRVVHRDIKPNNILVSHAGVVKVMDFGVARADFSREAKTESVQFGTFRYMAPERLLENRAGPESDVYSLGATFWELLAGKAMPRLPPGRESFDHTKRQLLAELMEQTPTDPRTSEALGRLLDEMLSHGSEGRPTAAEVEIRLDALMSTAKGPSVRNYARRVVPGLMAKDPGEPPRAAVNPATTAAPAAKAPAPGTSESAETLAEMVLPPAKPSEGGRAALFAAVGAMGLILALGVPAALWVADRLDALPGDQERATLAPVEIVEADREAPPEPDVGLAPEDEPKPEQSEEPIDEAPKPLPRARLPTAQPGVAEPVVEVVEVVDLQDEAPQDEAAIPTAAFLVTLKSQPPDVDLFVDGALLPGAGLARETTLPAGTHTFRADFEGGGLACTLEINGARTVVLDKTLGRCR